ncbi:hypothetical protein HPB49_005159 [Dermacentor silvarum]|uniref:Uncharacterized protein n=1 Tax=Dermacentor silvarum TaxID=543639 RepID=A0ACB8CPN5_DERSI|nr:hypothetical protein HPB49_005159 [Dermacentor silvarum]
MQELRSLRAEIQDLKTENVKLKSQLADTQPKRLTSNADIVPVPAVQSPHTIQQSTPHKRKALEPITQATSSAYAPEGSVNSEALTQLQQRIERKLSEALDCKLAELLDASITKALKRAMDNLLTAKLEKLLLPRIEQAFAAREKQRQEKMDVTQKAFQDMVVTLAQNHNTRLTELENSLLRSQSRSPKEAVLPSRQRWLRVIVNEPPTAFGSGTAGASCENEHIYSNTLPLSHRIPPPILSHYKRPENRLSCWDTRRTP